MRIRNRETYWELRAEGWCVQCGIRLAVEGRIWCDPCAERRYELVAAKVALARRECRCVRHLARPAVFGRSVCQECLDRDRLRHPSRKAAPCAR